MNITAKTNIEADANNAGFYKVREEAEPHRLLWRVKCSVEGCANYQDRTWQKGLPSLLLLKSARHNGWIVDYDRPPRCPEHAAMHFKSGSVTVLIPPKRNVEFIPPKPKTKMAEQLKTFITGEPPQTHRILPDISRPFYEDASTVAKTKTSGTPAGTATLTKARAIAKAKRSGRMTKDFGPIDALLKVYDGNASKASIALGLSPNAISVYTKKGSYPIVSMHAALYLAAPNPHKDQSDTTTLVVRTPESLWQVVTSITEAYKGVVAKQNAMYFFLILPNKEVPHITKILTVLPGVEFIGDVQ